MLRRRGHQVVPINSIRSPGMLRRLSSPPWRSDPYVASGRRLSTLRYSRLPEVERTPSMARAQLQVDRKLHQEMASKMAQTATENIKAYVRQSPQPTSQLNVAGFTGHPMFRLLCLNDVWSRSLVVWSCIVFNLMMQVTTKADKGSELQALMSL